MSRRVVVGSAGTTNGRVPPQDPYVGVPVTLNVTHHADFRPVFLLTYVALRSYATMEAANDMYCRCFPGIEQIAGRFGLHRSTVFRSLNWLEKNYYIYRAPRIQHSSHFTLIVQRKMFITTVQRASVAAAQQEYERWLQEVREAARRAFARGKHATHQRSHPSDPLAGGHRESPGSDFTGSAATFPHLGVAPERLRGVAGERRRSGATQIKIQQLGGSRSKEHLSSGAKSPEPPRSHKESEGQLPPPLRVSLAAKKIPPARMTEAQRQARWQELQRQRALLIAEAELAPK